MFKNMDVLDKSKHAELTIAPTDDYSFARELTHVPLAGTEVANAVKCYPIVFPMDSVLPQALLTIQKGKNAYLDSNDQWTVPYIPAHIRRYPFILGKAKDVDNYVVCVDRDAPHFQKKDGKLLFDEKGDPSKMLTQVIEFLKRFHSDLMGTEKLLQPLADNEILIPRQINLEIAGEKSAIRGFRVVDTKKLYQLEDSLLAKWVRSGVMSVVYAHILSLGNLRQMPIK